MKSLDLIFLLGKASQRHRLIGGEKEYFTIFFLLLVLGVAVDVKSDRVGDRDPDRDLPSYGDVHGDQQDVFRPDLVEGSNNRESTHAAQDHTTNTTRAPEAATGTRPACVEEEVPQKIRFYDRNRGVETWEECRDACNADSQCEYFRWKVSETFFVFYFKSFLKMKM